MKMDIELTNKMTLDQIKQNKLVTKADIKFLEEFIMEQGDEKTFENPFSGERVTCTGYLSGLLKFIQDVEGVMYDKQKLFMYHEKLTLKNITSKFDRARYLVQKLDQDVYMKLID